MKTNNLICIYSSFIHCVASAPPSAAVLRGTGKSTGYHLFKGTICHFISLKILQPLAAKHNAAMPVAFSLDLPKLLVYQILILYCGIHPSGKNRLFRPEADRICRPWI